MLSASPEKNGFNHGRLPLWSDANDDIDVIAFTPPGPSQPLGPSTNLGRCQWADDLWARLDPLNKDILIHNMEHFSWKDFFCGIDSRGQIAVQIETTINRHVATPIKVPKPFLHCDINPVRQKALSAIKPELQAIHRTSDVMDPLPDDIKHKIKIQNKDKVSCLVSKKFANRNLAAEINGFYEQNGVSECKTRCLNHHHWADCDVPLCHLHESLELQHGEVVEGGDLIPAVSAAVPCVDSSGMNSVAGGDGGTTFLASETFYAERAQAKEAFVWVECVKRQQVPQFREKLIPQGYFCRRMEIAGGMVGDTYERNRMGALALAPEYVMVDVLENFRIKCGSIPRFQIHNLWASTDEEQVDEMKELQQRRVHVPDTFSWDNTWTVQQRQHKVYYEQHIDSLVRCGFMSLSDSWHCVYDLDQNLAKKRGRIQYPRPNTPMKMLCILKHNQIVHHGTQKVLTSLDCGRAHCWPVTDEELETVGSIFPKGLKGLLTSGIFQHKDLVAAIGDGWHLRVQGTMLMWIMSIVVKKDSALKRSVPTDCSVEDDGDEFSCGMDVKKRRLRAQLSNGSSGYSSPRDAGSIMTITVVSSAACSTQQLP